MVTGKNQHKKSARNTCTNVILKCTLCKDDIWKYNMLLHFENNHSDRDLPDNYFITDEERSSVLKQNSYIGLDSNEFLDCFVKYEFNIVFFNYFYCTST